MKSLLFLSTPHALNSFDTPWEVKKTLTHIYNSDKLSSFHIIRNVNGYDGKKLTIDFPSHDFAPLCVIDLVSDLQVRVSKG